MKLILKICTLFILFSTNILVERTLQQGDLLFKDTQNDSFSDAIKEVTPSPDNYSFSHVGILFFEDNEWKVLEAIPSAGVHITSLSSFLSPQKGETIKVVVGRLKENYPFNIQKLIEYGKAQIGKLYDSVFIWNDEAFYCSELAYKMFAYAGQKDAFEPKPMTFKKKDSDEFHPTWVKYYRELKQAIPEGKLGINPNAMAKSQSITLLFELP